MTKKLDFDTPPDQFPEVWVAEEHEALDPIINKHVYIAVNDAFADPAFLSSWDSSGSPEVTFFWGDQFQATLSLERDYLETILPSSDEPEVTRKAANAFMRIAAHLNKCADEFDRERTKSVQISPERDTLNPDSFDSE